MKRFALIACMVCLVVLAGATRPTRWNQGGGTAYTSTVAGSFLIGDGAGDYTETTTMTYVNGDLLLNGATPTLALGAAGTPGIIDGLSTGTTGLTIRSRTAASGGADTGITLTVDGNLGAADYVVKMGDALAGQQVMLGGTGVLAWGDLTAGNSGLLCDAGGCYSKTGDDSGNAAFTATTITADADISVGDDVTMIGASPKISSTNNVNMTLEVPGAANVYVSAYGMEFQGTNFKINGYQMNMPQSLTIADNGNGGTAATDSSTPTDSTVQVTCNDANGCEWTLGEGGMEQMPALTVVNVSANSLVMKDSAGVAELVGSADQTLGQYDAIELRWAVDRWIQTAPIANN